MDSRTFLQALALFVLLEVILGQASPEGRLPIELPSSMAAVAGQNEDVPYDSDSPPYPYGSGLSYSVDSGDSN